MAPQRKEKPHKGRNGTGETVTLSFDTSDPAERKALNAARLLATKHGRRKQAIVALLEAVYTHYEATGELMSASAISAALTGQGGATERPSVNLTNTTVQRLKTRRKQVSHGNVEIKAASSSASTVATNFLSSMKGLASGFFD